MNTEAKTIRKFNPGTHQSDEEVIRQFVVREGELQIVLRTLADNVDAACCQHLLLIAPRGRGKTMMLARVAAEIRTNGELTPHYLPIRFMEESQEIFSIADFWLETLFHLANGVEKHDTELAAELTKAHADFATRWQERDIAEHVRSTVLSAADRIGKKLLLMVENLQTLAENVDGDFGWQLRETLQCEPQVVLLATATSRFAALDDVKEPFFELFRTINLEPLDTNSCRRLWQAISGDDPSNREIRPLQILTGGSPRFLVIMGEFSRHRSMRELLEELVTLIDDHTEYFRSYTEVLAKHERRVFLAVADLWQPSTTGEIAARARMDVRKTSALIGRLVNRGALIVHGTGRKQSYSVAERLYCIYYKLRRERDEAAVVHSLIRFMTAFYSGPEFAGLMDKFRAEATRYPAIQVGLERWSTEANDSLETKTQAAKVLFNKGVVLALRGKHEAEIETYKEITDRFADSNAPVLLEVVAKALVSKGLALSTLGRREDEKKAYDEVVSRFANSNTVELRAIAAGALFNKGQMLAEHREYQAALQAYDDVVARFTDSDAPELVQVTARALLNKGVALGMLNRQGDELATYDKIVRLFKDTSLPLAKEAVARALFLKAHAEMQAGRHAEVLTICDDLDRCVSPTNQSAMAARWLRAAALGVLGQPAKALFTMETAYKTLNPRDGLSLRPAFLGVSELAAAGTDERRILQILTSDKAKVSSFVPLIVALRRRLGEDVRVPTEVEEVAEDIMRHIEERSNCDFGAASATDPQRVPSLPSDSSGE